MRPPTGDARSSASWVIGRTLASRGPADPFIQQVELQLQQRDRRLMKELVFGTLRWLRRLDGVLEMASGRSLEAVDPPLRDPLRVATYQLLFLDRVPAHAAVDRAVDEARRRTHRGGAGFVNAVLRKIARSPNLEDWPVRASSPGRRLAIETSHPDFLVARWLDQFGETRTRELLAANNRRKPLQLLVIGGPGQRHRVAAQLAEEGVITDPSPLSPVGLVVRDGDPTRTEPWQRGAIYLQDVASQSVALLPPPVAGERVVDLAAAPGGKAFSLMAWEPEVHMVGADRSLERLQVMRRNRVRLRLALDLVLADASRPPWGASFDRVVLDLPCSGSGTLRKHPELKWRINREELERLSLQGGRMIAAAAELVRPAGLLSVATCSLEPEENAAIVTRFLQERDDFEPLELRGKVPASLEPGLIGVGLWQILPGDVHDGFTVSVLARRDRQRDHRTSR